MKRSLHRLRDERDHRPRALPDVRDGLKPVAPAHALRHERRWASRRPRLPQVRQDRRRRDGQLSPARRRVDLRRLVRMAQDFAMRYPLVDGQGNFGSIDGDPPAAMRYTEARLTRSPSDAATTSTRTRSTSFPTTTRRPKPTVLPDAVPNLLVNGSAGIAVGMATNIPPHNLREIVDAVVAVIDNPERRDRRADAARPGPRLPDRRLHLRPRRASQAYKTGRGIDQVRARAEIEEIRRRGAQRSSSPRSPTRSTRPS